MPARRDADRIWTVPNALSVSRLVLVACFAAVLFDTSSHLVAALLLGLAGVTDFLDGYVARRFNQVTEIGKLLDPTVDRIVLGTAAISLAVSGAVPVWLVIVVLVREVLVFGAAALLTWLHAPSIPVRFVGKAGTFGLMCTFPLFLLGDTTGTVARALTDSAWVIVAPSLVCAFTAAWSYFPEARRSLAAARPSIGTQA